MKFTVEFDPANKIVRAVVVGSFTGDTVRMLTIEVRSVLQAQPASAILLDLSAVTSFDISDEEVRCIAQSPSSARADIVRVVVAPQDHIFGVTRMFQAYAQGVRPGVYVVRSLEEACRFLAVDRQQQK